MEKRFGPSVDGSLLFVCHAPVLLTRAPDNLRLTARFHVSPRDLRKLGANVPAINAIVHDKDTALLCMYPNNAAANLELTLQPSVSTDDIIRHA